MHSTIWLLSQAKRKTVFNKIRSHLTNANAKLFYDFATFCFQF